MNKEIFLTVFNNTPIYKLIYNHIKKFKKTKNIYYKPYTLVPKNYKWKDLIETPHVLIEYGYLDLFRQYYNKYYQKYKYKLYFQIEDNYSFRFFEIIIRFNRVDVLDLFFKELKIKIDSDFKDIVLNLIIEAKRWELLDHYIHLFPKFSSKSLLFRYAPLSGSLDRLKHESAKESSIVIGTYRNPTAFDIAASVGRVDMIDWLLKNRSKSEIEYHRMYDYATKAGHINVIQYLIENNIKYTFHSDPNFEIPRYLIDTAVEFNQFETLKFICENHEKLSNSADPNLLDFAGGSDIEILDWLHTNRAGNCTYKLLKDAVRNGKLDIIQWVHSKRPELFNTDVMDQTAYYGYLDIIVWLHENRTEGCTTKAMDFAAASGNLDILIWLHENRTEGCTTNAIDETACRDEMDIIKWLHINRTEGATSRCILKAAECGNIEIMEWLVENGLGNMESFKIMPNRKMMYLGYFEAFKWIYDNLPSHNTITQFFSVVALDQVPMHTANQTNLDFYQWYLKFISPEDLKVHKSHVSFKPKNMYSDVLNQSISELESTSPKKNCILM